MNNFSIAIDGPAGAGKSSIAKKIAGILNCIYVDTGAMYRAVGYYCLENSIDCEDEEKVGNAVATINLDLKLEGETQQIYLNGANVSDKIRTSKVSAAASKVATYNKVRTSLVNKQQEIAKKQSLVMDGRDIGTVVLPNATLKIFLVATAEERANRRYKEYLEKGESISIEKLEKEIRDRDFQDSNRIVSPLKKADDAIEIDTTSMSINSVVDNIIQLLKERK